MEGTRCQQHDCNVSDFLPFHCELCEKSYCSAHRSRFIHDCISSIVRPYTSEASGGSPSVSVKQLFRDVEGRHDGMPQGSSKARYQVSGSAVHKQASDPRVAHLEASAGSATSHKQRNISNRTKTMLIKNKATGNEHVPSEDRFYIGLLFTVTGETRYFFFSNTTSIADMVEYICRHQALVAFGVPHPPEDKTLVTETADSAWNFFDRRCLLRDCFETCEVVKVSVLPISQVAENQNILAALRQPQTGAADLQTEAEPEEIADSLIYTPNVEYTKRERAIYLKSTEDPKAPIEFDAVIVGVHREDVELYYTVEIVVDGERREKQTDSHHLRKLPSASSKRVGDTESHLPELAKPAPGGPSGGFSVRVALGNKTAEFTDLFLDTSVLELEARIKQWSRVENRGRLKLICRGKTVPATATTLKDTNITPGCKISVMATPAR